MRRAGVLALIPFDPEIEKTCRRNRKERRNTPRRNTMAENNNAKVLNYIEGESV